MEEFIGGLWHRFITRAATRDHPEAEVFLADMERTAGVLFRALGGDAGLRVVAAAEVAHGARRSWLARIAHTGERAALSSRDEETLRLPARIACFADRGLNRDLYLWLIAQGAAMPAAPRVAGDDWIAANQTASRVTLAAFPGLTARYRRLVAAVLAERDDPARLPADEAAVERAIRAALDDPGCVVHALAARRPPRPVPLWLHPGPLAVDRRQRGEAPTPAAAAARPDKPQDASQRRRQAERQDMPDGRNALILPFRAESLLSFADFVKVNRAHDEDPDEDAALKAAEMDTLTIAQDSRDSPSRVRFDLDLPSAAQDDIPLCTGILLPEWDWKAGVLRPARCSLTLFDPRDASPCALPSRLHGPARRIRRQFEALTPARRWLKNQPEGSVPDIDACVRAYADRRTGHSVAEGGYLACERRERDLCCLVLADLSLSTDAWVNDEQRVVDVIRDSLWLFSEALAATRDPFALHGFSSRGREHVRFQRIKGFDEAHGDTVRGRIAAIKPGFYTRMGAPIRHAAALLASRPEAVRLLLILSDGKPNDVDHYEGRYGIEDTRASLAEARKQGIRPFCVTIDREGADYLPHLFGPGGYLVLRRPDELPARLPELYARITAG